MAPPRLVTDWFWLPDPRPQAGLRLFCFPHAGGDAPAFAEFGRSLPPDIEVWAVRLPGRGGRFNEAHAEDVEQLVDWICDAMRPHLSGTYALLGQSFGSLIAYNVGRRLSPAACVLAGLVPPTLWQGPPGPTDPSQTADFVRSIDDSVSEILEHPELSALLLSVVQADLNLCATYLHRHEPLLNCPVLAVVGADDPLVTSEQMTGWSHGTTGPFAQRTLPGGHLVLQSANGALTRTVAEFLHDTALIPHPEGMA